MCCIWLLQLAATSVATISFASQAIATDSCVAFGYHDGLLLNSPLMVLLLKRSRLLFAAPTLPCNNRPRPARCGSACQGTTRTSSLGGCGPTAWRTFSQLAPTTVAATSCGSRAGHHRSGRSSAAACPRHARLQDGRRALWINKSFLDVK